MNQSSATKAEPVVRYFDQPPIAESSMLIASASLQAMRDSIFAPAWLADAAAPSITFSTATACGIVRRASRAGAVDVAATRSEALFFSGFAVMSAFSFACLKATPPATFVALYFQVRENAAGYDIPS